MVYVFLADGFEDIEALAPIDIMRRAGIEVCTVGITGATVTSSHGVRIFADRFEAEPDSSLEMIVLPGGSVGTDNLKASQVVRRAIDYCVENDLYIAAICAAPTILGELSLLEGRQATCYPDMSELLGVGVYTGRSVTVDGRFITGKSAGHSVEFGLALVEALRGKAAADEVAAGIMRNDA